MLIAGDVAEEISELKRQPGKGIVISGSGGLVRSLLKEGLIDELRLLVHPVVVGGGKCLFGDGIEMKVLKRAKAETFGSGIVVLTYEPAGEEADG